MSGRGGLTVECICTACGWRSKRSPKNLHRPCPKCRGSVAVRHKEDQQMLQVSAIIALVIMVIFAVIFTSLEK